MSFREQFNNNEEYNQYFRQYREKNRKKLRLYHKKYNKQYRKENRYINEKKYKKKYPKRHEAYLKVSQALKKGLLVKKFCEICGAKNSQGHHKDYNKPLKVIWLCPICHTNYHLKKLST